MQHTSRKGPRAACSQPRWFERDDLHLRVERVERPSFVGVGQKSSCRISYTAAAAPRRRAFFMGRVLRDFAAVKYPDSDNVSARPAGFHHLDAATLRPLPGRREPTPAPLMAARFAISVVSRSHLGSFLPDLSYGRRDTLFVNFLDPIGSRHRKASLASSGLPSECPAEPLATGPQSRNPSTPNDDAVFNIHTCDWNRCLPRPRRRHPARLAWVVRGET